jgi:DNA-binding NtrC family response regulator
VPAVRGSNPSVSDHCSCLRMPNFWQLIYSVFTRSTPGRNTLPRRIPVVAAVVSEQDRHVLASVSGQEVLEVHFVESCDEACAVAKHLIAPVILFDRDLPGAEWRTTVKSLAASPHRACVVLMSRVVDDYLRQELIRRGGYEVLPKPLRADNILRVIKLALSYWISTASPGEAKPSVRAHGS